MRPNPKINEERLPRHSAGVTPGFFPSFPLSCFLSLPPTPQHPSRRTYKYSWQRWDGLPKAFRFQAKGFHSAAPRPHNSLSCPLCHEGPKSHIRCRPFNLRLDEWNFFFSVCQCFVFWSTGQPCKQGEGKFTRHLCKQDGVIISCTGWRRRTVEEHASERAHVAFK